MGRARGRAPRSDGPNGLLVPEDGPAPGNGLPEELVVGQTVQARAHVVEGLRHLPGEELDGGTHRPSLARGRPGTLGVLSRSWRPAQDRRDPSPAVDRLAERDVARHEANGVPRPATSAPPTARRRARAGRGTGSGPSRPRSHPHRASAPPTNESRRSPSTSSSSRPAPSSHASLRARCSAPRALGAGRGPRRPPRNARRPRAAHIFASSASRSPSGDSREERRSRTSSP